MKNKMATVNIEIKLRPALYTPCVDRPELGLTKGVPVKCMTFGCYQVCDGDDVNPYFVLELESGRCTYALPEHIQFIKEDEEC